MTTRTPKLLLACVVVPAVLAVGLAGCGQVPSTAVGNERPTSAPTRVAGGGEQTSEPTQAPSTPAPPAVRFDANVADRAAGVKVDTVVKASAADGKLAKVSLSWQGADSRGVQQSGTVKGTLSSDGRSWTAGGRLEPGAQYRLKLSGVGTDGADATATRTFRTQALTLKQQTFPELYPLEGAKVGVGMPVVLRFDVAVKDKKTFEQHLSVTSSPKQTGSWRWYSDTEVHYRPAKYWQPGTKVSVAADVNGLAAGNGVYGQRSTSTSFTVGRSVITRVNLKSHQAKVYIDDELARTIPISAGKSGWVTRSGTKLIMDKLYQTRMTNAMIGAAEEYDLKVFYAMRITNSGEFIHAAPWNSGNMGVANASHGCVGMNTSDARWLFERVKIGDPVVTTGSDRGVEPGNGYSDWNASFDVYKKGSAL